MSLRWLVEVRKDAPRWPYLLLWSALALLTLLVIRETDGQALALLVHALLRLRVEPLVFVLFMAVCFLQWRRPTVLGWAVTFVPVVFCTLLLGFSHFLLDFQARVVALAVGFCLASMFFLFRPGTHGKQRALTLALICVVLCGGAMGLERYREATKKAMGSPRPIVFPSVSAEERQKAFSGNFQIIRKMSELPPAIQVLYKEQNGTRFAIADPGQDFIATDVVTDSSLPWRRLIFAGASNKRCFVYYEQGGFASSFHVEMFSLPDAKPLWEWYVGEARDIDDLRAQVGKTEMCCTSK